MTPADQPKRYDTCGAKTRSGGACGRPAGWGTDHVGVGSCKLHFGSTPNAMKAAQVEVARQAVATYGLPRDVDPHMALLQEVHRTAGHVAWLADIVANLQHEDTDEGSGLLQYRKKDGILWRAPSVWVELYQEERKHLVSVCAAAIKAGVEERQVRLAEDQGALVMQVLQQVILALPVEHRETARKAAAQQLRLVAGA